jgi:hypothetical protein
MCLPNVPTPLVVRSSAASGHLSTRVERVGHRGVWCLATDSASRSDDDTERREHSPGFQCRGLWTK